MIFLGRSIAFLGLTLLTQIGGVAYLLSLQFRRKAWAFLGCYIALSLVSLAVAPQFGRVPLPCFGDDLRPATPLTCALNRQYVTPKMADVAQDLAKAVPGTLYLDANFPFWDGFPLLPHLSHSDGRKLDLALPYTPKQPSPIGYWAFVPNPNIGHDICPSAWATLRWDMGWLDGIWRNATLDGVRLIATLDHLARDPRVGKILLEPHLKGKYGANHPKIRFQGCRAARHDDHIHIQL